MYKNLDYWKNKTAIVTGAGHGIGAEIAQNLINIGMVVIGFEPTEYRVAQMCEKFASSKGKGQLVPCKCDVSKDEDLKNAFEGIVDVYGGVDVLINYAAIGKEGLVSTGDIEDLKNVIDANIYGLIACTRFAIQSMSKKEVAGLIININSFCDHCTPFFAEPKDNKYIALKRTMTVINKLIKDELESLKCKVRVTSFSPGIVRTSIFNNAGIKFLNEEFFEKNPHLTTMFVDNEGFFECCANGSSCSEDRASQ